MPTHSGNFPFCDGTHVKINEALGTSFRPAPVANETAAPTTINACMCGHSKKRYVQRQASSVLCDGLLTFVLTPHVCVCVCVWPDHSVMARIAR